MPYETGDFDEIEFKKTKRIDLTTAKMWTFDYHDGAESGLLRTSKGLYLRFVSLADSPTRVFRAFIMQVLSKNWHIKLSSLDPVLPDCLWAGYVDPKNHNLGRLIEDFLAAAPVQKSFLAICPIGLEWGLVSEMEGATLKELRLRENSASAYRIAHQLIKLKA